MPMASLLLFFALGLPPLLRIAVARATMRLHSTIAVCKPQLLRQTCSSEWHQKSRVVLADKKSVQRGTKSCCRATSKL